MSANANGSRQQPTAAQAASSGSSTSPYSVRSGQLSVSYMFDVFGLNRRRVESLEAQTEQQHYELQAAYVTLTSRIALTAIEEAELREAIRAAQNSVRIGRELLDALEQTVDRLDVLSC